MKQPVSIGVGTQSSAFTAGQTAAVMAAQRLRGQEIRGAIVLGSSSFEQEPLLQGVQSALPTIPLAGGSTGGEITPDGPRSHSCVVIALAGDDLAIGVGAGTDLARDPRLAGYRAAQQALQQTNGHERSGFVFFGDGLMTGYAEVLRGVHEVLGTSSLVTGALMADDLQFARTHQYANDRVLTQAVAGVLFGGAWKIGVGMEHGFAPISKPRRVTRAMANILYELDGQPASAVYEEYFGASDRRPDRPAGLTRELIAYPLGLQLDATEQFLLRNVRGFGSDGSVVCTGELIEGAWVQLMIGSKELAFEAASRAAQQAVQQVSTVHAVVVFDSVSRKQLLGHETAEEFSRIRRVVGSSVPIAGCYTYGEQAPLGTPYGYGRVSVQTGAILVLAIGR